MSFGTRLLLLCIIGFAFIDASSVRLLPFERAAYGLVLAVFGLMATLAIPRLQLRPPAIIFALSWLALGLIALLQGLIGHRWEMSYLVGDFGVFITPLLLFLACGLSKEDEPSMFGNLKVLDWLGYSLLIAGLISFFFGRDGELAGRYDPPNLFLAAWAIARTLGADNNRDRAKFIAVVVVFGLLAYYSNERTTVIIWAGGVAVLIATLRGRALITTSAAMAAAALIGLVVFGALGDSSGGFESRFNKIEGGTDDSLDGRYNEVTDMLSTVRREWSPMDYLVGAGHGATFKPVLSFPPRNVVDGRVHNIHIGPALMFYRYGLMGLFGWLWWLAYLLRSIPKGLSPSCPVVPRMLYLAGGFVFLDALMRNPFIDPVSCFAVAGIFHLHLVPDAYESGATKTADDLGQLGALGGDQIKLPHHP